MSHKNWWHNIGSGIPPLSTDDMESHANKVSKEAWDAAIAGMLKYINIDYIKPNSERFVKIWMDSDGNLKTEEIPISRIKLQPGDY